MPNDTLDEIEARWRQPLPFIRDVSPITVWRRAKADLDATIEMVRARDRVVEAAKAMRVAALSRADGAMGLVYAFDAALAVLVTPPAQEPGER